MLKSIHIPLSAAKEKLFTWERNAICVTSPVGLSLGRA